MEKGKLGIRLSFYAVAAFILIHFTFYARNLFQVSHSLYTISYFVVIAGISYLCIFSSGSIQNYFKIYRKKCSYIDF